MPHVLGRKLRSVRIMSGNPRVFDPFSSCAPTMPHKRSSDDVDHVPVDPKPTKKPRKKAPEPWPIPAYKPIAIANPLTYGQSQLPSPTMADSPYAIFSLFFTDEILATIRDHTNAYAQAQLQKACFCAGRKAVDSGASKRKALGELSINVQREGEALHKRRDGYRRSRHGCDACKIHLCRSGPCWSEHVEAIYGG